jgi:protein prenyltransferase alpha subunit repeat containing protein 1
VDGHLGVPKKVLYAAYLAAARRFAADRDALLGLSGVLLLGNPAHETALHARQRAVLSGEFNAAQELAFGALLLGGLKDAAKQAGLWHYRRVLLRRLHPGGQPGEEPAFVLDPEAWAAERALLERACELYPRNYYAWMHRAICVRAAALHLKELSNTGAGGAASTLLADEIAAARAWLERHVGDASAVHHLLLLAGLLQSPPDDDTKTEPARAHALGLVRAYPSHEALWLYLRGALAHSSSRCAADGDVELALAAAEADADREARRHAARFRAWIERSPGAS